MTKTLDIDLEAMGEEFEYQLKSLTDKQYKWLLGIVEGKTEVQAYKDAYKSDKMSDAACSIESYRIKQTPKLSAIITALRLDGLGHAIDDREAHLKRLRELSRRSEAAGNYGAAVNAEQSAGKVEGHYVEQHKDVTDSSVDSMIDRLEKELGAEKAQAVLETLGLSVH